MYRSTSNPATWASFVLTVYIQCTYHAGGVDSMKNPSDHVVALTTYRPYNFTDDKYDRECTYLMKRGLQVSAGTVWSGVHVVLTFGMAMPNALVISKRIHTL